MFDSFLISFVRSAVILFIVSIIYEYFVKSKKNGNILNNIYAGLVLGSIGFLLDITPCTYNTGMLFHFSSILLIISGLFFGTVPTLIVILTVGTERFFIGSDNSLFEIVLICTTGISGILLNYFLPLRKGKQNDLKLIIIGFFITLLIMICSVVFSNAILIVALMNIFNPIVLLYPFVIFFFGNYLINIEKKIIANDSNNLSIDQWLFALEGNGEGVWDWNLETNEVVYSKQWNNMLGYQEYEFKYSIEKWDNLKHPEDRKQVSSTMKKYLNGEISNYELECRLLCKDGSYKWILSHGKIIKRDKKGNPIRFIGTHRDISDRKEKELLIAHERYLVESLMKYTPESIYFKDLDSRFIRVNNSEAIKLGCESLMLIGKSDFDFYSDEFAGITFKQEQEIIRTGNPLSIEQKGIRIDGKELWSLTNKMPLRDINGNIIGTFGISIDITGIKEKELLLEQERYLIDSLLKYTPESIFYKDLESRFIRVNDASVRNMGCHDSSQVIGKTDFDFFTDEFAAVSLEQEQLIIQTGIPLSIIEKGVRRDGKEIWGFTNRMPLRDASGKIIGTFGISADITEMKEKELLLEHERYLVDSLLKHTPESIFFKDLEGKFIRVNKEAALNLGCNDTLQAVGKSDFDFYSKEFATKTFKQEQEIIQSGKLLTLEESGTRKDGKVVWGLTNKMPLRDLKGIIIGTFGISIDITKRKLMEESLKSSQEKLKSFAAHLQLVREEERVLLAREIHDELGQILIALKIDLGMLKLNVIKNTKIDKKEYTITEFTHVFDLLDKTIKTTRKIMTGLRPEALELVGILEAVRIYMEEFSERFQIKCLFKTKATSIIVDSQKSIALYRIFQEALSNIAKHAKATEVIVNFDLDANNIILKISDNGIGIDKRKKARPDSYGLIGMKERVYLLDGKISITGKPEKGTTITVEMPYTSK